MKTYISAVRENGRSVSSEIIKISWSLRLRIWRAAFVPAMPLPRMTIFMIVERLLERRENAVKTSFSSVDLT